MLFVSRECFNEFLLLLDVALVNKVLLLLLLLLWGKVLEGGVCSSDTKGFS